MNGSSSSSGLRVDPLTGHQVLIVPGRAARPNAFLGRLETAARTDCPFCRGSEDATPPATLEWPADGPWRVRVVPNKYPAVANAIAENAPEPAFQPDHAETETAAVAGLHEVIVESPDHQVSFSELPSEQAAAALHVAQDRLRFLQDQPGIHAAVLFKNCRAAGGASLEHVHSQLIGLPWIPPRLAEELEGMARLREPAGGCHICELATRERESGERLVADTGALVAWCPWAARFPYEVHVAPSEHQEHFTQASPRLLEELADLLQRLIRTWESRFDQTAYNYWVHSAPFDSSGRCHYHWHVEIMPRLTMTAGCEWGGGVFINPKPPEAAAETMRLALDAC